MGDTLINKSKVFVRIHKGLQDAGNHARYSKKIARDAWQVTSNEYIACKKAREKSTRIRPGTHLLEIQIMTLRGTIYRFLSLNKDSFRLSIAHATQGASRILKRQFRWERSRYR
jgi:hypothetical protein